MWATDFHRLAALAAGLLLTAMALRAQPPVGLPPANVMPRVDTLPVPATQTPVDLEALVEWIAENPKGVEQIQAGRIVRKDK